MLTPGVLMNPFPEHVPDDYDRAKKLKKEEMAKHHSLLQELPFKSMAYGLVERLDIEPFSDFSAK